MEAWNALGQCFWKKGELHYAKYCFTQALQLRKNKVSLRELSRVLRLIEKPALVEERMVAQWKKEKEVKLDSSPPSRAEIQSAVAASQRRLRQNVKESVEKAREAIAMDFKDGESWCTLLFIILLYFGNQMCTACHLTVYSNCTDALGNAYLSHYMINTNDMEDITKALQAFTQAVCP